MILDKNEIEFLKQNKETLKKIFEKRKDDFVRALVEEKDQIKTEAYKMVIKEWDNWILVGENVSKFKKPDEKQENSFTGI